MASDLKYWQMGQGALTTATSTFTVINIANLVTNSQWIRFEYFQISANWFTAGPVWKDTRGVFTFTFGGSTVFPNYFVDNVGATYGGTQTYNWNFTSFTQDFPVNILVLPNFTFQFVVQLYGPFALNDSVSAQINAFYRTSQDGTF